MRKILFSLILTLCALQAYAQGVAINGTVTSEQDNSVLPSARVKLTRISDQVIQNTGTDLEGRFKLERVAPGDYSVEVSYIGFVTLTRTIEVQNAAVNLGTLKLSTEATALREVQVIGRAPLGEQRGDTTAFNAKAFKTAPDASAEDLVTKMPGVTVTNGTIQAQGEDVKQVMIDGKRYAGDDVSGILRNLPSDAVESVQVFDRQSDQAAFSGFDDGNRQKTLNIVTRKDRRVGTMGKVSAGYGTDNRYMVGAAVNYFNNDRKITVTGLTNNINMLDFSIGETPGGGMRGRRGGWGGGSPNGIINTNTFGINYNDMWGKRMEVSGTYNYTNRDVFNNQIRNREYTSGFNIGDVLDERSRNENIDDSHRFNFRLQYHINDNNRLLITPSLTYQNTDSYVNRLSQTTNLEGAARSLSDNINNAENTNLNFNNNILYSHRFGKPGRVLTTNLTTSYSNTNGNNFLTETLQNFEDTDRNSTRNQFTDINRTNFAWNGNASISEKVGTNALLLLEYGIGNQSNDADRRTYDFDLEGSNDYTLFNRPLSNTYKSNYLAQNIGPSYQYRTETTRLQVNAKYQYATLDSDNILPKPVNINRSFNNFLPSAELEYKFTPSRSLNLNFRTNTNVPSVEQLADVLDISNPNSLRRGNASLEQDYQNRFNLRYRNFNADNNQVFFVGVFGTMTNNYVANSVYNAATAPAELLEGYDNVLPGARLFRPENLDGYWSVRSFFNYGQPINQIKSNINLNGSVGFTRTPGLIDRVLNYANTTNFGAGVNLSSNISEKIDFNVSTFANYNVVNNTAAVSVNNTNYFTQNTSLRYNWILWNDLVYRTELNHQYNGGVTAGAANSFLLWNMSIGKKLLKNKQAEISLSVNDLLNENTSFQNIVTESYFEDVQSTVLQRFFMLTFSYNIRSFAGGQPPVENERGGRPGGWGGGPPRN